MLIERLDMIKQAKFTFLFFKFHSKKLPQGNTLFDYNEKYCEIKGSMAQLQWTMEYITFDDILP